MRLVKILVLLLFLPTLASAQLTNMHDSTATQLMDMVDLLADRSNIASATKLNKSYFDTKIGQYFRNLVVAAQQRGVIASDYLTLTLAKTKANDSSYVLIIPETYSTDSTLTLVPADSDLVVIDYRGGDAAYRNLAIGTTNKLKFVRPDDNIQAKINALNSGDVLYFAPGTYNTMGSGGYDITKSRVKLFGSGLGTVFKNPVGTLVDTLFNIKTDSIELAHFRILSNDSINVGINVTDQFNFIHHIEIDSMGINGLRFEGTNPGGKNNIISDVRISGTKFDGISIVTSDNNVFNSVQVYFSRDDGIELTQSDGTYFNSCFVQSNTGFGIKTTSPTVIYNISILGGNVSGNHKDGIAFVNTIRSIINGVVLNQNGSAANTTYHAIKLDNSDNNTIVNNWIGDYKDGVLLPADSLQWTGILLNAASDSNMVSNNFFDQTTLTIPITNSGSRNSIPINYYGNKAELSLLQSAKLYLDGFGSTTYIDYGGTSMAFVIGGTQAFDAAATQVRLNQPVLVNGTTLTIEGGFSIGDTTGFVLSGGAATITSESNVILDTEAGAALDTVTTLTGSIGQIVFISSRADARDLRFLDSGNFTLGGERTLDDADDILQLKATSATTWKEVNFKNNN